MCRFQQVKLEIEELKNFMTTFFNTGPRNCIGQKYAMYEMKLTISRIIQKFKVTVSKENANPEINSEVVLKAKGGVNLEFSKRK